MKKLYSTASVALLLACTAWTQDSASAAGKKCQQKEELPTGQVYTAQLRAALRLLREFQAPQGEGLGFVVPNGVVNKKVTKDSDSDSSGDEAEEESRGISALLANEVRKIEQAGERAADRVANVSQGSSPLGQLAKLPFTAFYDRMGSLVQKALGGMGYTTRVSFFREQAYGLKRLAPIAPSDKPLTAMTFKKGEIVYSRREFSAKECDGSGVFKDRSAKEAVAPSAAAMQRADEARAIIIQGRGVKPEMQLEMLQKLDAQFQEIERPNLLNVDGGLLPLAFQLVQDSEKKQQRIRQIVSYPHRSLGLAEGAHVFAQPGFHYMTPLRGCCPPSSWDLRDHHGFKLDGSGSKTFPAVYNQGGTLSCTAQAFAFSLEYLRARFNGSNPGVTPSRSYIWNWEKYGDPENDGVCYDGQEHTGLGNWGCNMAFGTDLLTKKGVPLENADDANPDGSRLSWSMDPSAEKNKQTYEESKIPTSLASNARNVAGGLTMLAQSFTTSQFLNVLEIKKALWGCKATCGGRPVFLAITIYQSSYLVDRGGDFVMPFSDVTCNKRATPVLDADGNFTYDIGGHKQYVYGDQVVGGHAIALVGYDDEAVDSLGNKGMFTFRNSWGGWGKDGYGRLPYAYVAGNAIDFPAAKADMTVTDYPADSHEADFNIAPDASKVKTYDAPPYAGFMGFVDHLKA